MTFGDDSLRCRFCGGDGLSAAGAVDGYRFWECAGCGFVFTPEIDRRDLLERYRNVEELLADGMPVSGWAPDDFMNDLLSELEGGVRMLLDFGCGESRLPALLRDRGHRVMAVDVAPPLRDHPDRLTGDVLQLPLPRGGFDMVYSYQVFEHLPEPRPILERLLDLLRPGGKLVVHTDMEVAEREAGLAAWSYACPPDHCSFYRHRTFGHATADRAARIARAEPHLVVIEAQQ